MKRHHIVSITALFTLVAATALAQDPPAAPPAAVDAPTAEVPGTREAPIATATEAPAAPALPTADEILSRIDENLVSDSRTATVEMRVEGKRRTRTFKMKSFGRGETDSAMVYLSPSRDKGTKMLKLGDEMWLYLPTIGRVQKISGHMLRDGMMGSDISYEDMMNGEDMRSAYKATIEGEDTFDGRPCWKLVMIAHDDSVSYPKRVSWIDKELYIPLKQELYALSGMLLKTWTMTDIKLFDGRQYPTRMTISDHLKKGSKTTLTFSEMTFGVKFPGEVFSRRWLERR